MNLVHFFKTQIMLILTITHTATFNYIQFIHVQKNSFKGYILS